MPESQLEQAAKTAPQQEKKEEKPVSVVRSTLEEIIGATKAAFNLGVAAVAPLAGYVLTGNPGVLATSAAFVAGTKGKKSSKTVLKESLSGAIFGTFAHYTLLPLRYLTAIGKAAYVALWALPANTFYLAEDHLVKKLSPKGLYKKIRENALSITKKAITTGVLPLNILSAMVLPPQYIVASIAVATYLFRRFVAGGKGEEHADKTPYYVAASNVGSRFVKNTAKGLYEASSAIGSTLYEKISNFFKAAPAPTLQTKPA